MIIRSKVLTLVLIVLTTSLLFACSRPEKDPTKDWTPERFYAEAKKSMKARNYQSAIGHFETLEARFPYGVYAQQAQLEIAYAYYKNLESELAIAAADRFIRLHPTHPNADYAYYLKGLIQFKDRGSYIGRLLGMNGDLSDRDQEAATESYKIFKELADRYPKSRYAHEARKRVNYLYNAMAKYEIKVAQFYFDREAYVATISRAKIVLEKYQGTQSIEDALGLMVKAYDKMGLEELKLDSIRVLEKNFPESAYLKNNTAQPTG